MKKILYIVFSSLLGLVLIAGLVVGYILYFPFTPKSDAEDVDILVRWGSSFGQIAHELQDKGVVRSVDQLKLTAKIYKKEQSLRVGKFTLKKGMSNYAALFALIEGPQSYIKFTLPDGYGAARFARIIEHHLEIDSAEIVSLVTDSSFIAGLGLETESLEGYLYPETYSFTYGLTAKNIVTALVNQFNKMVTDSLKNRMTEMGWTLNEVLTLASIVEGEAMVDTEMPIISSVYQNRLRVGMRLQADPTIQYIIPDGPRRLLYRDLEIDSPYNTYLYAGLPPGPINNPGINAIKAVLYPAETKYIYFVANGDGTHSFSENYNQHLRAKKRFDQYRKKVEDERKREAQNDG
jgi:UPF0755 protein